MSYSYSESIAIAASPDAVYRTISDITRTGEWSPVCKQCWWNEGNATNSPGPEVGATFTGRNDNGNKTWDTTSTVIAATPGIEFGWTVAGGLVNWNYTITSAADGARLTESWEFTDAALDFFHEKYGADAATEINDRRTAALQGIPATLAAIKTIIEADE